MSYALEGPKWNSQVITWSFADTGDPNSSQSSGLIDAADQGVIERAIAKWASVSNLTFVQMPDTTAGVDIRIGWSEFGTGGQIGNTSYSYTPGSNASFLPGVLVELEDPSQRPLSGNASDPVWQGTSTTLYQVALHEIGHALGLDHSPDDRSAAMYSVSGSSNRDLDQSDISGIQALYGAPSSSGGQSFITSSSSSSTQASSGAASTAPINLDTTGMTVYRFLDTGDGTHFFSSSATETATVIATRPDMKYEGAGMQAASASDPSATAVYRFLEAANGTHFYTASGSEKDAILATRSDLKFEGIGFYEHASQQAGDTAVYRFLDTGNGTHFYTASQAEIASISATRPDLQVEGIAFYAPT